MKYTDRCKFDIRNKFTDKERKKTQKNTQFLTTIFDDSPSANYTNVVSTQGKIGNNGFELTLIDKW